MNRKPGRSGIEKRVVTSIVWVGVIPMMLAMLIGYLVAREGQQLAVEQNLRTAASKTVEGIRLVIQERERSTARIAHFPEIISWLHAYKGGSFPAVAPVVSRFEAESHASGALRSRYVLYDATGKPVISSGDARIPPVSNLTRLRTSQFIDLNYVPEERQYVALLAAPVMEEDGTILGYLLETQSIEDILVLILEDPASGREKRVEHYEIIFFSDTMRFVVYLDEESGISPPPPKFVEIYPRLAERLEKSAHLEEDSFLLWNYPSRGISLPVLMAYRRLTPGNPIMVAVHRSTPDIFANLNIAAAITLGISSLVIGIFCVIAYRIVNNTIIRPLSLLNEGAQIIRQGDLDLKLRIDTDDEIQELADSFNQMAAALRSNMRELKTSEEKYRKLIHSMRDGIFQTDAQYRISFINPAGVAILGFDRIEEACGRSLERLFVQPEAYAAVAAEIMDRPFLDNKRVWLKRPDRRLFASNFPAPGSLANMANLWV